MVILNDATAKRIQYVISALNSDTREFLDMEESEMAELIDALSADIPEDYGACPHCLHETKSGAEDPCRTCAFCGNGNQLNWEAKP